MAKVITFTRHYNVRQHETWTVTLPDDVEVPEDPDSSFDQMVCDKGSLIHTETELLDNEDLEWEVAEAEPWCNHDAVAVVDGVCECGVRVS